ncbi:hypothetical protein HK100_002887 [Physocladia obscura]|uniref:Uncharacterized protein n=1 Tax=Physocladia obscura TaxID=109957 RepID=A0AAD5XG34_9FUNG|nr:hypothetical protein HK100_002887 [Physocladia obscura]
MNKFWLAKHNIVGSATYSIRRYATTPIGKIDLKAGGDGSKSSNSSSNKSSSWNRLSLGKKRKPPPKFQSKLKPKTEIRLHNPVFILIVVQSTQNTAYLGVILAGVAAGGMAISYVIYDFVEDYYSGILFDDAFAKVSVDPKVIDMVGTPMKGHGGLGPRGHPTNPK